MEYYSFSPQPEPEHRKAKPKKERLYKYPMIEPDKHMSEDRPPEDQPTKTGHWEKSPVTGQWTFIHDQQPTPTGPIVIRAKVLPGHVPAPDMKVPVMPAPRPIRIIRQHSAKRGAGITRRSNR